MITKIIILDNFARTKRKEMEKFSFQMENFMKVSSQMICEMVKVVSNGLIKIVIVESG
jgi:hypothetical protein